MNKYEKVPKKKGKSNKWQEVMCEIFEFIQGYTIFNKFQMAKILKKIGDRHSIEILPYNNDTYPIM